MSRQELGGEFNTRSGKCGITGHIPIVAIFFLVLTVVHAEVGQRPASFLEDTGELPVAPAPGSMQSIVAGLFTGNGEATDPIWKNPNVTAAMVDSAPVPAGVDMNMYPSCPSTPERTFKDDLDYFLYKLTSTEFNSQPFPFTFFCNMFHPDFYGDLRKFYPPVGVMQPAVKRKLSSMKNAKAYSAAGSNNVADKRWKMSVYDIHKLKATPKWPELEQAKPVWKKLESILFSAEVEKVLWDRFNLTRKPKFHDFRLQSDHQGYSIGAHPDSPKKILTMMFYVPTADNTVYDFGTCLHTSKQYKMRNMKKNGEAVCWKKFLFASNTGYSFVVNDHSYHSVNTVGKARGIRQTILVNWYDQMVGSLMRHKNVVGG